MRPPRSPRTVPTTDLPFVVDQAPATPTDLAVAPAMSNSPWVTSVVDPELSAVLTDPGTSGSVTGVFEVRQQGTETLVASGADEVESGARAVFTVPPEGPEALHPGDTYEFRVGTQDSVAQSQDPPVTDWSGWVSFTVAEDARVSVPLQLAEPLVVWESGPDLTWTPYRDPSSDPSDDLVEYQIFRSCVSLPSAGCENPVDSYQQAPTSGLDQVGTVRPGDTSFRDRTATSSSPTETATYRYWVVARTEADVKVNANGATASNPRVVSTTRTGRVRRVFIGDLPDATISNATGKRDTPIPGVLQAGNDHPDAGVQRALLAFDVSVIDPGMRLTQASVQVTQSPRVWDCREHCSLPGHRPRFGGGRGHLEPGLGDRVLGHTEWWR